MEIKMSDKVALAVISAISTGIGALGAILFNLIGYNKRVIEAIS
ncbi:hypothetical protein [Bacillus cereus]|nr:hypothetical protein [Bacillus cereus]